MKEYDYEKRVMGSEASLSIVAADRTIADRAAAALFEIAENEEERFSRFREGSELSRLNRERSLVVSDVFMEVLLLGREFYRLSGRVFNPLVDISRFGYDADITLVKGMKRVGKAITPYSRDMEAVHIDEATRTVSLSEGQHLDFGGYVKGYAAEKMAKAARDCQGVVVNLGGDVYVHGRDAQGDPFIFAVDDPTDGSAELFFGTTDVGIATSGSYNRHWEYKHAPFFHILDGSGVQNPITSILSATVIAPTGAEADALATAALVLGVAAGGALLEQYGSPYCFITKDGSRICSDRFPLVQKNELHHHA